MVRNSRISTHLLFGHNSFSRTGVETPHLKEKSRSCSAYCTKWMVGSCFFYVGDGRRSLSISRFLYFIECQRYLDAYLTFSSETISLDSRSGCCLLCFKSVHIHLMWEQFIVTFQLPQKYCELGLCGSSYVEFYLVLHCATIKIQQNNFYWSCNSKSSVLWRTRRKWGLFSFKIRLSTLCFSVFAVFFFLFACPREEAVIYLIILKQRIWSKVCLTTWLHHNQTFLCIFLCHIKELWRCLLCFQNPPRYARATHLFLEE